jgi:DNA-directed RNA polymerase I subunit RPA2
MCAYVDEYGDSKTVLYKGHEEGIVDKVTVVSSNSRQSISSSGFSNDGPTSADLVRIRIRHPRNPIIGDKFSSRHGQKGLFYFIFFILFLTK